MFGLSSLDPFQGNFKATAYEDILDLLFASDLLVLFLFQHSSTHMHEACSTEKWFYKVGVEDPDCSVACYARFKHNIFVWVSMILALRILLR